MQLLISSCIRNFRLPPASALLVSVNAVQIFGPATQPPFSVGLLTVRISQVWFRVFVFVFVFILAPPPTTPYAHVGHVPVPRRRAQPAITGHVVGCYAASCASATANSYSGAFCRPGSMRDLALLEAARPTRRPGIPRATREAHGGSLAGLKGQRYGPCRRRRRFCVVSDDAASCVQGH